MLKFRDVIWLLSINFVVLFSASVRSEIRDLGPLYAFKKVSTISISECAKTWTLLNDQLAECEVNVISKDRGYVLGARDLIYYWKYKDGAWEAYITAYQTTLGYKIQMSTKNAKHPENLNFAVAQKYIGSFLEARGKAELDQTLLTLSPQNTPQITPNINEQYLGPVVSVLRTIRLSNNAELIKACEKKWTQSRCTLDLIKSTRGEALLKTEDIGKKSSSDNYVYIQSQSAVAWLLGNSFSDYKLNLGASSKTDFSKFQSQFSQFSASLPSELLLLVQKIDSNSNAAKVFEDKDPRPINLVSMKVEFDFNACKQSFKKVTKLNSSCQWKQVKPGYLYDHPQVFYDVAKLNGQRVTTVLWHTPNGFEISIWGDEAIVSSANQFALQGAGTIERLSPYNLYFDVNR